MKPKTEKANGWLEWLSAEKNKDYHKKITKELESQINSGLTVTPSKEDIYRVFTATPLDSIKIVIIGQDPYPKKGVATGLSFAVSKSTKIPASLRNIFKELIADTEKKTPESPEFKNLTSWASQGVFLLNSSLTTLEGARDGHSKIGWEAFTDSAIEHISNHRDHIVFILWGKKAQKKSSLIDSSRHKIISSPHPSPLSARRGFFGSKPFTKSNDYLKYHKKEPIDWNRLI